MKKKPMSFFALSVATANTVYNVSFIALLAGTVVVLLSASALIWANVVRERDASRQISQLATADNDANAAARKAQADLAEASRELAQANAAKAAAEKDAADARAAAKGKSTPASTAPAPSGRTVSLENRQLFIDFVKTVSKGRVVVEAVTSDPEAAAFARQVADMLRGAGYGVVENYGSPVLLGTPPTGVEMRIRSMVEQPVYAGSLQKGLEFIGIPTSGNLDPGAGDGVIIFIGSKP